MRLPYSCKLLESSQKKFSHTCVLEAFTLKWMSKRPIIIIITIISSSSSITRIMQLLLSIQLRYPHLPAHLLLLQLLRLRVIIRVLMQHWNTSPPRLRSTAITTKHSCVLENCTTSGMNWTTQFDSWNPPCYTPITIPTQCTILAHYTLRNDSSINLQNASNQF